MTYFIKLENGAPVGAPIEENNFRSLFPTTSFTRTYEPVDIESLGFGIYDFASPPAAEEGKKAIEVSPQRNASGIWVQSYAFVDMTAEEIEAQLELKKQAIRSQRNAKLSATDWTQVLDAPVNRDAWATYRQALRNVPEQEGFPHDVQWPVEPT